MADTEKGMHKPAKKAIMEPNPSKLISALQSEVAGLDLPLPIIVEKWLTTENGRIRLTACRSQYGWHWEIGSARNQRSLPVQIVSGNQGEVMLYIETLVEKLAETSS